MSNTTQHGTVVTRFAPSPTGFLHIGGARTALFNWLYARHRGGRYLLRIEDTDRARSTDAAIAAILDGLQWLGLEADDEATFQSTRADRHREVVETLLAGGHAYRCYCTPEELDDMRKHAEAQGLPPVYDGRWRDRDPAEAPAGVSSAIRLKTPSEGQTVVCDEVQGAVTFENANLDDLVILRSDGTPTYNLAVVVDDHDMGVSHVIRGVDHLTNAARQTAIYDAMGWPVPVFAHVPLIHGPDGAKLSKRHGALGVEAYRAMGYLPEALRNYLVRLGWSHGDKEIFTPEEMIALFDLDGLGKSPARFDFDKLADVNAHYLRTSDANMLVDAIKTALSDSEDGRKQLGRLEAVGWEKFHTALPVLKERATTLTELVDAASFLMVQRPIAMDDKAAKILNEDTRGLLHALTNHLAGLEDWSVDSVDAAVRAHIKAEGLKLGQVGPAIRAALTGTTVSPPIFDMLGVLGRDEALGRLRDQCA